jgi:hypothetical protein
LRPTKGEDSYPKIAIRASNWFRAEKEKGRDLPIDRISAEHVRRIFEDMTARPDMIYLEALAAVQNVNLGSLLSAAGYAVPQQAGNHLSPKERFIIHAYRSASTPAERKKLEDIAREICEEEEEEFRNGTPSEP